MKEYKRQKYIQHILLNLPKEPGVYKFKDDSNKIIYVGKAKNLKNRVSSYFQSSRDQTSKTKKMVEQIADIEYITVGSDLEAIMLETNLIKELHPKYNVLMKDDKNYVYIKITVQEDFPRILITRKVEKDKARYFGPKTAKYKVERTLKVLKRIFPYRHCSLAIDYIAPRSDSADPKRRHKVKVTHANIKFPCIDYHIKRCIGPCIGTVDKDEYRAIIDQVIRFLEGKHEDVIEKLKADMDRAAADRKFELAAAIRDKLQAIKDIMEDQRISTPDHKDLDVINYVIADEKIFYNLFQIRSGKLINQENFELKAHGDNPDQNHDPEALSDFLQQYYEKATDLPQEVLIPEEIQDQSEMESWLTEMRGHKVKILVPQRGRKNKLLELSHKNALSFSKLSKVKWQGHQKSDREKALQKLAEILKLESPPKRLECFDVSHFSGTQTVSSMVVFQNGFPFKPDYRKFKLHQETPGKPDDFASMEETLSRRLRHLKPSIESNQIRLLKSTKKELKDIEIQDNIHYFTIKKEKEPIGVVHILETDKKKFLIQKLEHKETLDLRLLSKKITQKLKTKRLYIACASDQLKLFEEAGYIAVRKVPDDFPKTSNPVLVYDATKHLIDTSFKKKPDLIIIDGGKGQLGAAMKALKKYQMDLPIISIAKKNEEIYLPGKSLPIIIPKEDPTLRMIQHIRDESHRFAITFHQGLQMKATKSSILDSVYGIGEATKMKLLKHFGSPESIKNATMYELEQIVGKKNAIKIKEALNK